jgi:membrane protein implicated in regulation of membrane protease activity
LMDVWFWAFLFLPFIVLGVFSTILTVMLIIHVARVVTRARRSSITRRQSIDSVSTEQSVIRAVVATLKKHVYSQGKIIR